MPKPDPCAPNCQPCREALGSGEPTGTPLADVEGIVTTACTCFQPCGFPTKCDACGEGADREMGEFTNDEGESRYVHAQCGFDAGWDLA